MPRRRAGSDQLSPWLTANENCKEKRFIMVGNSLLLCPRYHALHDGAKHLYQCMADESGGKRQFTFPASAAKKYGIPRNSFERYKQELIENGFVRVLYSGRLTREKSAYEFSFEWKSETS